MLPDFDTLIIVAVAVRAVLHCNVASLSRLRSLPLAFSWIRELTQHSDGANPHHDVVIVRALRRCDTDRSSFSFVLYSCCYALNEEGRFSYPIHVQTSSGTDANASTKPALFTESPRNFFCTCSFVSFRLVQTIIVVVNSNSMTQ